MASERMGGNHRVSLPDFEARRHIKGDTLTDGRVRRWNSYRNLISCAGRQNRDSYGVREVAWPKASEGQLGTSRRR